MLPAPDNSGTIVRVNGSAKRAPVLLETLADRVWYALHSRPRDERGRPPPPTVIEAQAGLPRGALGRLFRNERKDMRAVSLKRLAPVLGVSVGWLASGEGEPPRLSGPIGARDPLRDDVNDSGVDLRAGPPDYDDSDPSPARAAAIVFARACAIDERAIKVVRGAPARGYTPDEWFATIKSTAAAIREHEDGPESSTPAPDMSRRR